MHVWKRCGKKRYGKPAQKTLPSSLTSQLMTEQRADQLESYESKTQAKVPMYVVWKLKIQKGLEENQREMVSSYSGQNNNYEDHSTPTPITQMVRSRQKGKKFPNHFPASNICLSFSYSVSSSRWLFNCMPLPSLSQLQCQSVPLRHLSPTPRRGTEDLGFKLEEGYKGFPGLV